MATKKHVFTHLEKKSFLDILKKYSRIIENKETNGVSLRAKNIAWDNVTREYNANPHATNQISSKQLRRLWMNLKQRQKEALIKKRRHRVGTGGGPSISNMVMDPDIAADLIEIDEAIDSDSLPKSKNITMEDIFMDTQPVSSQDIPSQNPSTNSLFVIPTMSCPVLTPSLSQSIITTCQSTLLPSTSRFTPPASSIRSTPPPTNTASVASFQRHKNKILEREYVDRQKRANEFHERELMLLNEKIREAKAKADLAELLLQQQRSTGTSNIITNQEGRKE